MTAVTLTDGALRYADGDAFVVGDDASARLVDRLLALNLVVPDLSGVPEATPTQMTVIIPVKDRAEQLARALGGLAGLEVLVVDDASDDREAIARVAAAAGARYLRLETNVGPAGARNAGLAEVRTPLVAFVDSDIRASR